MSESRSVGASLSRNTIASILGRLLYVVTRVGLPPLILHYVSVDAYGIWATCFVLISYIGMGAFGVSNAYIRFVAEYNAKGEPERIGQLLSAGLVITLGFSAVTLLTLWLGLPWLLAWFNIPVELQPTARVLILGTVSTMLLDLTFGAFAYVLSGLQKIVQTTVVWICSFLLETALIVGLLVAGWGVNALMWAFVARYVFSILVDMALVYRAVPSLRLQFRGLRAVNFRPFLDYGGVLQIVGLLSMFLYSIEKVLAGYFTGIGSVAILDVGQKIPMMASQVTSAVTSSFLPAVTHLHSLGRSDELRHLYLQGARYLNLMNGLAMGFMAAFAGPLIAVWIGDRPDIGDAAPILLAATLGFQVHQLTGPASSYFQGVHQPARLFEYVLLQCALLGLGLAYLVRYVGYDVVVIAELVAGVRVIGGLIYIWRANRSIGLGNLRFFQRVLVPGLLPYAWGFGLLALVAPFAELLEGKRWMTLVALLALGLVYVLWSMAFLWLFQMGKSERHSVRAFVYRRA